jgi:hypothetical protein
MDHSLDAQETYVLKIALEVRLSYNPPTAEGDYRGFTRGWLSENHDSGTYSSAAIESLIRKGYLVDDIKCLRITRAGCVRLSN